MCLDDMLKSFNCQPGEFMARAFQKSLSWLRRKQACVIHNPNPRFSSPFMAERSPIAPSIDKPVIVRDCMSMTLMVEKLGLMRMHNWNQSLRHKVKKPAGTVEEVERHFGCESARLIMVGDRLFTDIVYGNRTGFFMILPEPLSLAEEPLIGRIWKAIDASSSRVEELKTKKILVRHVEKATNSEDTFDVLRSFGPF
ncbi:UNVERIFIED_CONTAM: hypothetical protein Scaly_2936900 [Sesamum calycinum]|uniref:Uncharacterized protein n=1 Tax=Sesamum calycinum TaxID=2727403 RepID=A0AAW2KUW1_9LAMI